MTRERASTPTRPAPDSSPVWIRQMMESAMPIARMDQVTEPRTVGRDRGDELLEVTDLRVAFPRDDQRVDVLHGVSFAISAGETVAIVGESGSGKSVMALSLLGLLGSGRCTRGSIRFDGRDLTSLGGRELRRIRGRDISMIFQDPLAALDPLFTVGFQIGEALRFGGTPASEVRRRTVELLRQVGMPDPERKRKAYPHELSGGQRQRVVIAIAVACAPKLVVADEPTTALDATVEEQILELLRTIQRESGTSLLIITHDMSVVARIADRVVVMYAGTIVEEGRVEDVLDDPRHPYTQALIAAVPRGDMNRHQPVPTIDGSLPSVWDRPPGCGFAPRCPYATDQCRAEAPPAFPLGGGRESRCWLEATETAASAMERQA